MAGFVGSFRARGTTKDVSGRFIEQRPTANDCWRGIILFGNNVATYKFALARALLDLKPAAGQLVKLEELAVPYVRHLCDHLRLAKKQSTSARSEFLDSCRKANAGELNQHKVVDEAVRLGFVNVIDAFHIANRKPVPEEFFVDERTNSGGIRVTDSFAQLLDDQQASSLPEEAESRWRLVETAWEQRLNRALLTVNHDPDTEALFVIDSMRRRKPVTGARTALSGYQKGHCFYCGEQFLLLGPTVPDVDHFFPHSLKALGLGGQVDGVWNLVLACLRCNRERKASSVGCRASNCLSGFTRETSSLSIVIIHCAKRLWPRPGPARLSGEASSTHFMRSR